MNEFIEKNRRLLKFYCEGLRTIGSVILILGLISGCAMTTLILISNFGGWHIAEPLEKSMIYWPSSFFTLIFFGLGILGLAQFIRYLFERDYQPGWILRHGEIIFYLYALLNILNVIWFYFNHPPSPYSRVFVILVAVFSTAVKVFILVVLGQILRRLIPVIEESKTLV